MATGVAAFIIDIQTADQIPIITEPQFSGTDVQIESHPVMSLDDLKKGIPQAAVEANSSLLKASLFQN